MTSLYDFAVRTVDGQEQSLNDFRGEALLIVNVASQCGFTPQYAGLEALYRKYRNSGFAVLGFPCNQFGEQEPGTAEEIASFCSLTYDVTFPLFAKIDVNGGNADPLFTWLKERKRGLLGTKAIKWNFTKFLIDRTGAVVDRYAPLVKPEGIERAIQAII
ncbi:glutathione peroxidase [Sphingobium phenoxybenzoativorans]|uniref:Glutathione peroxidase n=1 Tax=Sphingobium phenoxybenzoativorans TaxID=1592790 RepID=A0A975PZV6_9SPHN|nr:glutathione peroxidase [Sphingobium phenoxybenzoativorans]QUT04300.1 glutathione peroxidase [Sphingobium phenoxybenzoativorans]